MTDKTAPNNQIYDIYLKNPHSRWMQKLLKRYNRNIVLYLKNILPDKNIRLLEIGPGRGYFYQTVKKYCKNITYTAIDRNETIINKLGASHGYQSDALKMPIFSKKFDLVYAAYVIEHMRDGISLNTFFSKCKKNLVPGGLLIILTNNALKQGMEFWHADYTHIYPTTARNVAMALYDSGFQHVRIRGITDFSIFLTSNASFWPFLSVITRLLLFWYNQNIFSAVRSAINSILHKENRYILSDIFFQFHIFTQHQGLFIIAKV